MWLIQVWKVRVCHVFPRAMLMIVCTTTDMRMGRDQQWQMPHRFMHNGNAPYGMGTGVSPMPPSSGSYSMYNRAGHRMSPQRADKAPCFTHPGKMQVRCVACLSDRKCNILSSKTTYETSWLTWYLTLINIFC